MARLIVGHVTSNSAKIWVRGDRKVPFAFITVNPGAKQEVIALEERHGFTGVVTIAGLAQDSDHTCEVEFASTKNSRPNRRVDFGHCRGKFRTLPPANSNVKFKFLLGSCNLHSLGIVASPDRAFEELLDKSAAKDVRLMIHCGDQIYYDIPNFLNAPDVDEYRAKYLDAWGDSRPTRKLLTQMPHYMIMDDHEITDNFANDMESPNRISTPQVFRQISMKVYREFVHIRQPNGYGTQALYYDFSVGDTRFFVMDTRTERFGFRKLDKRIVGESQMAALTSWLKEAQERIEVRGFKCSIRHGCSWRRRQMGRACVCLAAKRTD